MYWKHIVLKHSIVNRLPFVDKLRNVKRKIFGYPLDVINMELTLNNYERMKSAIENLGISIQGSTILEIGSGWFPAIPILLIRDGAKTVMMSDLNVHMDEVTFQETVTYLKKRFIEDSYIQNLTDFNSLPINYLAPFNISNLNDKSLDIIVSHTVLEHIPKSDIYNLFSSLRPKMIDNGSMVHLVDHSDHFEHYDKSISRVNFLTWNEEKYAFIYYLMKHSANRMRHHEYQQVFTDSGYKMIYEEADLDQRIMKQYKTLDLTYPYSKMRPEQLATVTSLYFLKTA